VHKPHLYSKLNSPWFNSKRLDFGLWALIVLLVTACAQVPTRTVEELKAEYQIGKRVTNPFVFVGKNVPLPEGNWKIVGFDTKKVDVDSMGGPTVGEGDYLATYISLADTDDGVLGKIINIFVPINVRNINFFVYGKLCQRKSMIYCEELDSNIRYQKRRWVASIPLLRSILPMPKGVPVLYYLQDEGIELPKTMYQAGTVLGGGRELLEVRYNWNTRLEGITPDSTKKWNEKWYEKVKNGFEGIPIPGDIVAPPAGKLSNSGTYSPANLIEELRKEFSKKMKKYIGMYKNKPLFKTFALAVDKEGNAAIDRQGSWAISYSWGYSTQQKANDRALSKCRDRALKLQMDTECKIYTKGDELPSL
jgi:hypothetical protein